MNASKSERRPKRQVLIRKDHILGQYGDVVLVKPENPHAIRFVFAAYPELVTLCGLVREAYVGRPPTEKPTPMPSPDKVLARIMTAAGDIEASVMGGKLSRGSGWLSGLAFCVRCEMAMIHVVMSGSQGRSRHYECEGRWFGGSRSCRSRRVPARELEGWAAKIMAKAAADHATERVKKASS